MSRQDVVSIHTHFALQHPWQLCKCQLSRCPVAARHLQRVYLGVFHGWWFSACLASLHSTLQLLYFSWVKSPRLLRLLRPKILWPSACQQMVLAYTPLAPGTQALPTDDSSFILWLIIMNLSLIFSHQTQMKIIFWPIMLQQGAAYCCSGCHLLIAKGFGDPTVVSLRITK